MMNLGLGLSIARICGLGGGGSLSPVLIDRTSGVNIGDMIVNGGLAAAFDGNDNQDGAAAAAKTSGTGAYVGKTLAEPSKMHHVVVYSSNNQGFVVNANPSVTIELYGKNGAAPINPQDGTLLGSEAITDTATRLVVTVNSSDQATVFEHVWASVITVGSTSKRIAELELWALE